jgi:hypothetical protein
MVWIKRNLIVVIGGVVSVALLAVSVIFAQGAKQKQDDAAQALQSYTNSVKTLLSARPFPNDQTISKFEAEAEAVRGFSRDAEKLFAYTPPSKMGGQQFKIHLLKALVQLQADATNNNVQIPDQYQFTFGHLVPMPNLVPYSIQPLQESLDDIQHICQVLYSSRVHALEHIQRFPAYLREPGQLGLSYEYWPRTNVTSSDAVFKSTPYVFRFRGFTSELTEVLNRFASADRFYVVRKIDVVQASGARRPGMMMGMGMGEDDGGGGDDGSMVNTPINPGATLTLAQRMRLMQLRAQQQNRNLRTGAPPALRTVVDEKPLRVSVVIDVVKLIPGKKESEVGPGGPGMAGPM